MLHRLCIFLLVHTFFDALQPLPGLQNQCCFFAVYVGWVQALQTKLEYLSQLLPPHLPCAFFMGSEGLTLRVSLRSGSLSISSSSSVSNSVGETVRADKPSLLSIISSASLEKNSFGLSSEVATVC